MRHQSRVNARDTEGEGQYDPWEMCYECDYWGDCDYYPECGEGWEDESIEYWSSYYDYDDYSDDYGDYDFCDDCEIYGDCDDFGC